MSAAEPVPPATPPPTVDRAAIDKARARLRREAERGRDPGTRTRIVAAWVFGLACLELGHLVARVLVSFVPKQLHFRDPPFVATAAYAAAALVLYAAWRGLRRGAPLGRAVVPLVVLGSLLGTYLGINTASRVPGPSTSTVLRSLAESWRGVGWPGMLVHVQEFEAAPSGLWSPSDVAAAGFAMLVGFTILWLLVSGARVTEAGRRAPPTRVERVAGYVVSVHLAMHAFLTVATIVGLSWRVAGHSF